MATGYNSTTNTIDTPTVQGGQSVPTSPFLQEQAQTAANQGQSGYTALGDATKPAYTSTPSPTGAINTPLPQSTTTLSSNKTNDVTGIQNTTNNLTNSGLTTTTDANGNQIATYADNTPYVPGADNSPVAASSNGISNGGYVGETYYPLGSTLPTDSTGNYASVTPYSPTDVANINSLAQLKSQADATTAAYISSIQANYQTLIQQQQQANTANQAGETALLLKNGGLQHTGSGANVVNQEVSYGLSQIADLQNKMNTAVLQAQTAGQNQDFQLQEAMNKTASDAQANMQAVAAKLQDQINTQNQALATQKLQATKDSFVALELAKGVTDPNQILADAQAAGNTTISASDIATSISNLNPDQKDVMSIQEEAAKNGAPQSVISAIGSAKTVDDAINASGSWLQTATGALGDYLEYQRQGGNATYQAWTDAQAQLASQNAANTAGETEAAKLAADAQANGVTPKQQTAITGIINKMATNKQITDFENVQNQNNIVTSLPDTGLTQIQANELLAAATQILVPGTSSLRGSASVITGQLGSTLGNLLINAQKSVDNRGNLSDTTVQQIKDAINSVYQVQENSYNSELSNYVSQGQNLTGLDSDTVKGLLYNADTSQTPTTPGQLIQQQENTVTTSLNNIKTSNPKLYSAASAMYTSNNPDTGQPYSAADILQAFPELNSQ